MPSEGKESPIVASNQYYRDNSRSGPGVPVNEPASGMRESSVQASGDDPNFVAGQQGEAKQEAPAGEQNTAGEQGATGEQGAKETPAGEEDKSTGDRSIEELLSMLQHMQDNVNRNDQGQSSNQPGESASQEGEDVHKLLAAMKQEVASGEKTPDQVFDQLVDVMGKQATQLAKNAVDEALQQKDVEQFRNKYLQENPDFPQAVKSPEFNRLLQENPILDRVAGYERLKRLESEKARTDLAAKVQELQAKVDTLQKQGAESTANVGRESGSEVREAETQHKRPRFREDRRDSVQGGLAALQRARQA